jgi:hypothetical protein
MFDEPQGAGLGAAGNWSDSPEAGGESTVGVVAAQLGVAGLVLYVGLFLGMIGSLVAVAWRRRGPVSDVALVVGGALLGLFVMSFVSESASGLLGNAPYFIFAGWLLAISLSVVDRVRFQWGPLENGMQLDEVPVPGDTSSR